MKEQSIVAVFEMLRQPHAGSGDGVAREGSRQGPVGRLGGRDIRYSVPVFFILLNRPRLSKDAQTLRVAGRPYKTEL